MNVQLSEVGHNNYSIHTIDPKNKDPRYHETYCGRSFCCATVTKEAPDCQICSNQGRLHKNSTNKAP